MTAQPVTVVPNAAKAPPAPIQGGHGLRSFIDYLGTADSSLGAPSGLSGSTALVTSLRSRKLNLKDAPATQSAPNSGANPNDPSVAQAQALALSLQASAPSVPASAANAASALPLVASSGGRAIILANSALDASNSAAPQGSSSAPTAANANSFLGLIAAGSALAAPSGQPGDPGSSGASGDAAPSTQNAAPASLMLNEATPTVTPSGAAPPHQAGPLATAFVVNQFGAPGASSTNDPAANATSAAPSSDKQASDAATGSAPPSNAAPGSNASANTLATLPGAAALNARIVAGAATLTDHPNQAAAPATAALTQPADPNAGALPPSASPPDAKTHDNSGFGFASTSTGSAAAAPPTGANPATDPRNSFAAALDRAGAGTQTPSSSDASKSSQDSSGITAGASASGTSLPLPQADTTAGPAAPAPAPNDAGLHPALIALPASAQVAINLKQALAAGTDEIQIQLKPASLGTIDVKLNVNHDGRLTAVISADRSDTLNLLKQDAGNLQQSLRDAGFAADSGSLSFNLRSETQSFAQNAAPQLSTTPSAAADLPAAGASVRAQRQHAGTLDIEV